VTLRSPSLTPPCSIKRRAMLFEAARPAACKTSTILGTSGQHGGGKLVRRYGESFDKRRVAYDRAAAAGECCARPLLVLLSAASLPWTISVTAWQAPVLRAQFRPLQGRKSLDLVERNETSAA